MMPEMHACVCWALEHRPALSKQCMCALDQDGVSWFGHRSSIGSKAQCWISRACVCGSHNTYRLLQCHSLYLLALKLCSLGPPQQLSKTANFISHKPGHPRKGRSSHAWATTCCLLLVHIPRASTPPSSSSSSNNQPRIPRRRE